MKEMGVKVTVNSDAHQPQEITGEFASVFRNLRKAGYESYHLLMNSHFEEVEIPK
jgi:histidinol phosphatase-like PHP family hydrolase